MYPEFSDGDMHADNPKNLANNFGQQVQQLIQATPSYQQMMNGGLGQFDPVPNTQ